MAHRVLLTALGFLAVFVGSALAHAQDGAKVTMTALDCRRLSVHLSDPGVAYRPGVDAHGRAVAPAELGGAPIVAVPETIVIPIEVDLQKRFGFPANPNSYEANAEIGTVAVDPEGRARFNGQPLQDEEQTELARRCQEILYGRP